MILVYLHKLWQALAASKSLHYSTRDKRIQHADCAILFICSAALGVRERATNIRKKGFWNRVFNSTKHRAGLASLEQSLKNESKKFEVWHSHFLYYLVISRLLIISYSLAPFCHSCILTTGRTHEGINVERSFFLAISTGRTDGCP